MTNVIMRKKVHDSTAGMTSVVSIGCLFAFKLMPGNTSIALSMLMSSPLFASNYKRFGAFSLVS